VSQNDHMLYLQVIKNPALPIAAVLAEADMQLDACIQVRRVLILALQQVLLI